MASNQSPAEWFVDSSFWYTFANRRDSNQSWANAVLASHLGRIVTTAYVLAETTSLLTKRIGKATAIQFLQVTHDENACRLICPDPDQLQRAETLFAEYADWDFDLVDAVSFVVMRDQGIDHALTFDHHFEQMGSIVEPPTGSR